MTEYTERYRLHQQESEDNFLHMNFNEDFVKIDPAIAARGSCLQVVRTYIGGGNYKKGKATILHFPFRPLAVMVIGGSYQATSLFLRPGTRGAANDTAGMGSVLSLAWGEDSLPRYVTGWASGGSTSGDANTEGQLNERGAHYTYLILG